SMQLDKYYSSQQWQKIQDFAAHKPSPFFVVDLDRIEFKYQQLQQSFPMAHIFYAVKANPSCEVLRCLDQLGSCFDVASVYELDPVIECGVSPDRISFGNSIKIAVDVQYAEFEGVRLFVTDAHADLEHISQFATHSRLFFRDLVRSAAASDWP